MILIDLGELLSLTQDPLLTSLMTLTVASSFILGALVSLHVRYPERLKGDIAAFSAGIFFATVAFILIDESIGVGSFTTMAIGFSAGVVTFSISNKFLKKQLPLVSDSIKSKVHDLSGQDKTKEPKNTDPEEKEKKLSQTKRVGWGYGNTVIVGKLMDSLPKALFIGVIVALDLRGLLAAVIALFLGNITATIEGARRMSEEGKTHKQILTRWIYVSISVAIAGPIGYFLARPLSNEHLSILIGFAAGDLIAFIVEDLIPESYKKNEWHTGVSAGFGFLTGIAIFHFL
jgi:ZIP family zinc transporter